MAELVQRPYNPNLGCRVLGFKVLAVSGVCARLARMGVVQVVNVQPKGTNAQNITLCRHDSDPVPWGF